MSDWVGKCKSLPIMVKILAIFWLIYGLNLVNPFSYESAPIDHFIFPIKLFCGVLSLSAAVAVIFKGPPSLIVLRGAPMVAFVYEIVNIYSSLKGAGLLDKVVEDAGYAIAPIATLVLMLVVFAWSFWVTVEYKSCLR